MKYLLYILIAWMSIQCAYAQVAGNKIYQQRGYSNRIELPQAVLAEEGVLQVDIKTISNVQASSYVVMFSLNQPGETIEQADQAMNARIKEIRTEVNELPRTEVFVDMISLLPVYEIQEEKKIFSPNTFQEVPKGFEMKKNLHIRYERPEDLDRIVTICAQHEVYDIIKVHYIIEDFEAQQDSLRAVALALFQEKIAYYEELGLEVEGKRRDVSEGTNTFFPFERYETYQPYSSTAYDYRAKGEVEKAEKKPSEYYNPVSFKGYDIVLNPEIIEPVVQFSYSLRVKIYLEEDLNPEPEPEVQKDVYLLTPNGDLRKIEVD